MSFEGHALLKVIEAIEGDAVDADTQRQLAETAEQLYSDIELAPKLWHTKEGLRKELRQRVRSAAHQLGYKQLKQLPIEIEQIAIKYFARSQHE